MTDEMDETDDPPPPAIVVPAPLFDDVPAPEDDARHAIEAARSARRRSRLALFRRRLRRPRQLP